MRVLYIGYLNEGQTSRMRMEVLRDFGHEIYPVNIQEVWGAAGWLSKHLQQRVGRGPTVDDLNARLLKAARSFRPHLLWAEKQEHIKPATLAELRKLGVRLMHYTPDPYFTLSWKRTPVMDAAIRQFDVLVTSKKYELAEYEATGREVIYVPLGFDEKVHRPLVSSASATSDAFASDVGFVGGWEPRREEMLTRVAGLGRRLKVWGYAWDHLHDGRWSIRRAYRLKILAGADPYALRANPTLAPSLQGNEVYGDEYAWALSGAKIGIGFLRRVCPDQHTTRTFEIPACGSMLLADRTEEHREFFEEGREAEFYDTVDEMLDKLRFYGANEIARAKVAQAGYERCFSSGYSYRHRVAEILDRLGMTPTQVPTGIPSLR